MTILTSAEAANALKIDEDDENMLDLLAMVDAYIEQATGRDWAQDDPIDGRAKAAARMLLTQWHENPAMYATGLTSLAYGLSAVLTQLEALAVKLEKNGIPDETLEISASMPDDGEDYISTSITPILIFNHEMAAGATSAVALKTLAGAAVTTTNTLDVTNKIMTIAPAAALSAATNYQIVVTAAADVYGKTLTETLSFKTA